ncbi:hypothetical protein P3T76_005293 [Phytophthora citrophthora]|uniref:Uncharacterized protein n=1 Tax=Phytophthora citrophthora TaxID=4793 RepID=A0AAD9LQP4_9STRA|nr:hypothetical protein P3T76_005293 [Phytophthora citrophthora]
MMRCCSLFGWLGAVRSAGYYLKTRIYACSIYSYYKLVVAVCWLVVAVSATTVSSALVEHLVAELAVKMLMDFAK